MRIAISSGHGKYVRGASGYLDEVDEARRVVEHVADYLEDAGIDVLTFHDDVSTTQDENLNRIVDFHNARTRKLDVSVHFNAYQTTSSPMGVEVLYVTQAELAETLSAAIAEAGNFIDRGEKYRSDLYFLNATEEPAILIETCFVDSLADADLYRARFTAICGAIATVISGGEGAEAPIPPEPEQLPLTEENRVDMVGEVLGDVVVFINGEAVQGAPRCPNIVRLNIATTGDVLVTINGQDLHPQSLAALGTGRTHALTAEDLTASRPAHDHESRRL